MAQLVDARFARGWRGEVRSRATEVRAEEPRFAVLLERAQLPAAAMGRPHDQAGALPGRRVSARHGSHT